MHDKIIHHYNTFCLLKNQAARIRENDLNYEKLNEVREIELRAREHQITLHEILKGSACVIGAVVLIPVGSEYIAIPLYKEKT